MDSHITTGRNPGVLLASFVLSLVLGSIHAFSVFIPEWEQRFSASRADISLIYSLALVALTVAVLFGYQLFAICEPWLIFVLSGAGAAAGLWLASDAQSLSALYVWYGLLFGTANGLGYAYALQLAGQVATVRSGLAMSLVTAFYAVGATLAPPLFVFLIQQASNTLALRTMAGLIVIVTVATAIVLYLNQTTFITEKKGELLKLDARLSRSRKLYWLAYGSGVSAGLMVIGHAFAIAVWQGANTSAATVATMLVAAGNMVGGFAAGILLMRGTLRLLMLLPAATLLGLLILFFSAGIEVLVLLGLTIAGFSYGALIAVYPVSIAERFGTRASARIYGQVFTAWGVAGLIGPWLSGWLFDLTGSYQWPILLAAVLSCLSCVVVVLLSRAEAESV